MYQLLQEINIMVDDELADNYSYISAKDVGLDTRAGRFYISEDGIAVSKSYRSALEYYGGFEYVDKDYVITVGDYTFYASEDNRVAGTVSAWLDNVVLAKEFELKFED